MARTLAVATSAVREASNGGDFIEEVARQTGIHVRVITGEEEGRLIYRAVRHFVEVGERRTVAVDIGGGSIEIILGTGERALLVDSLKLGHIRMSERLEGDPPSEASVLQVRATCRRALDRVLEPYTRKPAELFVGTSGTIETFARLDLATDKNGAKSDRETHLHVVEAETVQRLTKKLLKMSTADRRKMPGLDPQRADVICAGGIVLEEILAALGAHRLTVCTAALREGLILDYMDRARERIRREDAVLTCGLRSVNELMHRTAADSTHAAHVSRLASSCSTILRASTVSTRRRGGSCTVAALVHDTACTSVTGAPQALSLPRHERGLRGFTGREVRIIANVARYHRRALPRAKHAELAVLPKRDQRVVRVLSALLRVADGLDRSHNQIVEAAHCQVRDGRATFHLLTWHDAELEVWGARRKSDLFEVVFEAEPHFQLEKPDDASRFAAPEPAAAESAVQAD